MNTESSTDLEPLLCMPGVVPAFLRSGSHVARSGRPLDQHNEQVYGELLDRSAKDLAELSDAGII